MTSKPQDIPQDGRFQRGKRDPRQGQGGARPGSGRPAEWLKAKCREIVDRNKLVEFLGRVAKGEDIDQMVTPMGECLKVPASVKNRIAATTELLDRGYGKPNQVIEVQLGFAMTLVAEVMKALRLVPTTCPHCKTKMDLRQKIAQFLLDLSKRFDSQEAVK